jgi:hypothetical protein
VQSTPDPESDPIRDFGLGLKRICRIERHGYDTRAFNKPLFWLFLRILVKRIVAAAIRPVFFSDPSNFRPQSPFECVRRRFVTGMRRPDAAFAAPNPERRLK